MVTSEECAKELIGDSFPTGAQRKAYLYPRLAQLWWRSTPSPRQGACGDPSRRHDGSPTCSHVSGTKRPRPSFPAQQTEVPAVAVPPESATLAGGIGAHDLGLLNRFLPPCHLIYCPSGAGYPSLWRLASQLERGKGPIGPSRTDFPWPRALPRLSSGCTRRPSRCPWTGGWWGRRSPSCTRSAAGGRASWPGWGSQRDWSPSRRPRRRRCR